MKWQYEKYKYRCSFVNWNVCVLKQWNLVLSRICIFLQENYIQGNFFSKMSKKIFTNTFYCIISILHGSIVDKQWSILLVWSWYFNRIEYWIRTHPFILFKCSLKAHRFAFRYKFDAVNAPIYSQYLMHTITSQNS